MVVASRPSIQSALTSFYQREINARHLRNAAAAEPKIPSTPAAVGECWLSKLCAAAAFHALKARSLCRLPGQAWLVPFDDPRG